MTIQEVRKMSQEDANQYQININIIYDKLSEYPVTDDGEDNCYSFCSVDAMDIMYPQNLNDYWEVIELIIPNN